MTTYPPSPEPGAPVCNSVVNLRRYVVAPLTGQLFDGDPQPIGTCLVAKHDPAALIDGVDRLIRGTEELRKLIRDRAFSGHASFPTNQ